jgi:transcriptional regulator with XRE-family HTH domain
MATDPRRPFNVALGHNLRMARLARGISLEDVTQALNGRPDLDIQRKPSAVGHYESGRRPCPTEIVSFLVDLYGVPLAQVFPDGDRAEAKLAAELAAAQEALARERAMAAMLTEWMRLAKSTNPELSQLDAQVAVPEPIHGKGGGPVVDPNQPELPLEA